MEVMSFCWHYACWYPVGGGGWLDLKGLAWLMGARHGPRYGLAVGVDGPQRVETNTLV